MRTWSEEQRNEHSRIMKEYYEKYPDAKKKKKWSEETKRKYGKNRKKYYAEHPDVIEKMSKSQKKYCEKHLGSAASGIKWSEEAKKRHSKIQKEVKNRPEERARNSKCAKIRWDDPEERKLQSERITKMINTHPEIREANSISAKIRMNRPERRRYQSEIMKKWWANYSEEKRKFHMHRARSFLNNPSKAQLELFEQIKLYYPTAELEYSVAYYHLDIVLLEFKINIEFDGVYWHQNSEKDKTRDNFLQGLGWRVLRIREKEQFDINILHKLVSQS